MKKAAKIVGIILAILVAIPLTFLVDMRSSRCSLRGMAEM